MRPKTRTSRIQDRLRRHQQRLCLAGFSALLLSGCAGNRWAQTDSISDHVYSTTTPQMLQQDGGFARPVQAAYPDSEDAVSVPVDPADQQAPAVLQSAAHGQPDGVIQLRGSSAQNLPAMATAGRIQLTAFQEVMAEDPPGAPHFLPGEPRLDFDPNCPPGNQMEIIGGAPLVELFPDEYVMDGGDRNQPFAHHTSRRSGLDSEDTVAEFTDHTGAMRMAASNRVAVYAPRFGSIRTVTGLVADTKIDRASGTRDALGVENLRTGHAAQESVHDTVLSGLQARDRVDGMVASSPPMEARRTDAPGQTSKVDEGHEGRVTTSAQGLERNDGIAEGRQILNAITWTRDLYPVMTASTTNAAGIAEQLKVQQTIAVEDERRTKGAIQIVKLADRDTANEGDVVTFRIRFRNTGDFDVYDVRIVDNLTPRLEYVAGSATVDPQHPGEVTIEPNGEGSSILTVTLDKPLKGHEQGEITFEARVR